MSQNQYQEPNPIQHNNYWLEWGKKREAEAEEEALLKTWKRLVAACPDAYLPEIETRTDTDLYAQALLFRNANCIKENGLFIREGGLKIYDGGTAQGKPTFRTIPGGSIVSRYRTQKEQGNA